MAYLGMLKKDDPRKGFCSDYIGYGVSKIKTPKNKVCKYKGKKGYSIYLKTDWWINRKKKFFESHLKICYCCGNTSKDLHHNNYSRMGRELDKDLIPLCHDCHTKVHEIQKQTGKLKDNHKELRMKLRNF